MSPDPVLTSVAPSEFALSGVAPVEAAWGGFRRGGAYLLVGPARGGRLRLMAHALGAAVSAGERTAFVSPREPEALAVSAAEARFDFAAAEAAGALTMHAFPATDGLDDDGLAGALDQLAEVAATRLIVEDFAPIIGQFRSFEAFVATFQRLLPAIETRGTTLLLGLGEPADAASQEMLASLQTLVAGTVRLDPTPTGTFLLTLVPGTAHEDLEHETVWEPDALRASALLDGPAPAPRAADVPSPETPPDMIPELETIAAETEEAVAAVPVAEPHSGDGASPGFATTRPYLTTSYLTTPFVATPDQAAIAEAAPAEASTALDDDPFAIEEMTAVEHQDSEDDADARPLPNRAGPPASDDPFGDVGEDSAPFSGVELVPPDDPLFEESWDHAADLFAADPGLDTLARGHLVDSNAHGVVEPSSHSVGSAAASADDVFDAVIAPIHAAAYPEVFKPAPKDPSPAEAFRLALADAFARRYATPFLVLALRMEPLSPHAAAFGLVAASLRTALSTADHLLVDEAARRLVVLLPGRRADTASALFDATRAHLAMTHGEAAGPILTSAGALVVPNGQPFSSADELLAYVMG